MNKYDEIKEKHQKIVNKFPMKFAFSDEQFNQGMKELGLEKILDLRNVYLLKLQTELLSIS